MPRPKGRKNPTDKEVEERFSLVEAMLDEGEEGPDIAKALGIRFALSDRQARDVIKTVREKRQLARDEVSEAWRADRRQFLRRRLTRILNKGDKDSVSAARALMELDGLRGPTKIEMEHSGAVGLPKFEGRSVEEIRYYVLNRKWPDKVK